MLRAGKNRNKHSKFWIALLGVCMVGVVSSVLAADPAFRTWSDSSGKFKITAKFVSLKGDVVTLAQEDGTEIEIPLKKLATVDQKEAQKLSEAGDNPFETKKPDNPFESAKVKGSSKKSGGRGRRNSGAKSSASKSDLEEDDNVESVDAPISGAKEIALHTADTVGWNLTVPAPPKDAMFPGAAKSVALPGKEFFERNEKIVVNPTAKKAILSYHLAEHGQPGRTRMVMADLTTGRPVKGAGVSGNFQPLALSDDGKMLVVHKIPLGWGKGDEHFCEIWKMDGGKDSNRISWEPFKGEMHNGDVVWGAFLGSGKLVLSSRAGTIGVWKIDGLEPIFQVSSTGGAMPALSPDQKLLVFSDESRVMVVNIEKQEVVASTSFPAPVKWPSFAFSPTGKQIGCLTLDHAMIWETTTGKLLGDMATQKNHIYNQIEFPSENFLLGGKQYLFNVPDQMQVWHYNGHDVAACAGGWSFLAVNGHDTKQQGLLIATQIPHPGIKDLQERSQKDPSLFVLREGTVVKLDVNALPDAAQRSKVIADLTSSLSKNQCKVGDNGTISLVATIEGPKERNLRFRFGGVYKFQELRYGLKFDFNGTTVWTQSHSNVPHRVTQKRDETFETALRAYEKANYDWFGKIELPKYLQKPGGVQLKFGHQQSGFGLGQSLLTTTGMK